ncbi:hypothetical protein K435DRAFT_843480 [Dendrothele bispora CBS 962.96]|uniref:C2H2-type domain-containing protein n=1 Tax=Dendrothele bispora (strain CBS 962.96) TaxID=1314807 RepID=A0A4S8L8B7_DENBC|nr:hypothetical protein K435DRAFT_843480 [Dendrothele bispora CBS 962.96]
MPRAKRADAGDVDNSAQCTICNVVIANKTDMPRHMKIHAQDKDKLMHRCPYPDCSFENLQKSNVETHIRTHTKSKTNHCPDCDFTTVDPGSLTRHRKRIHGYIPKMRKPRQPRPQQAESSSGITPSRPSTSRYSPYTYTKAESDEEDELEDDDPGDGSRELSPPETTSHTNPPTSSTRNS